MQTASGNEDKERWTYCSGKGLGLSLGFSVHPKNQTSPQNATTKYMETQSDGASSTHSPKRSPAVLGVQLRSWDWSEGPKLELKSTWDKVIDSQAPPGNPHLPAPQVQSKPAPTSPQQLGRRANPAASGRYRLLITRD